MIKEIIYMEKHRGVTPSMPRVARRGSRAGGGRPYTTWNGVVRRAEWYAYCSNTPPKEANPARRCHTLKFLDFRM